MRSRSNSAIAPEDVHLQVAGRRRGVDALRQTDERHAEHLEFLQQRDQMLQVASEPIEAPADDDIEPATSSISDQLIEGGASILCPAHPAIHVLDGRPASGLHVPPDFSELVLRFLLQRADAGVDGGLHAATLLSALPAFKI
jgi:hypothetical protein